MKSRRIVVGDRVKVHDSDVKGRVVTITWSKVRGTKIWIDVGSSKPYLVTTLKNIKLL